MKYDKEIRKLEKKLALLKAKAERSAAKNKETAIQRVSALVKKLGYASIHHLLQNVDDAIASVPERIRKRTKITEHTRKGVIAMLKAGKTAAVTAKMNKVSTATVNNIKKAAGLTKSKKAAKASVPRKIPHSIEPIRRTAKKVRTKKRSKTVGASAMEPIPVVSLTE